MSKSVFTLPEDVKIKKSGTNILEKARRIMGITRDQYAFCSYVQYRCADPRQRVAGWCCDLKEEIADFVGISRPGVHKMARAMEQSGLISISKNSLYRVTETWIDIESDCKQSLQKEGEEIVNKVYIGRKQSLHIARENRKQSLRTPYKTDNTKLEGERTPTPALEIQDLQSQKNESEEVAPAENPETLKAEIPPSKKVAPKKDSPNQSCINCEGIWLDDNKRWRCCKEDEDAFAQWLPSLHTAMENNAPGSMPSPLKLGFCGNCMGLGYRNGRNGQIPCDDCDGMGNGNEKIDARQFEVTAIASPTDLPGVTLVEAAPKIRAENTIEAEVMIARWITGEGEQTVKARYSIAMQKFDPDNAAAIAAHYCSCFTKNAANKGRLLADPITHFSDGLFSYLKNEESWGRNNAPKEGGQTRNGNQQSQKATLNRFGSDPAKYQEKPLF